MKLFFCIAFLFLGNGLSAQDGFAKQLRGIISDSAGGFSRFHGELKIKGETTSNKSYLEYASSITLENTMRNNIRYLEGSGVSIYSYDTSIADSVGEEEGERICDEWKENVLTVIGKEYKIRKIKSEQPLSTEHYGWELSDGNLSIEICLFRLKNTTLNHISFSIDYMVYSIK